jgi:hypothetical protein
MLSLCLLLCIRAYKYALVYNRTTTLLMKHSMMVERSMQQAHKLLLWFMLITFMICADVITVVDALV